jgi:hypothetical protein
VGYYTENSGTNTGQREWTDSAGMPCIWILDMFPPSPNTTIIIPFKKDSIAKPAHTNYFGEIPDDRIKYAEVLYSSKQTACIGVNWVFLRIQPKIGQAVMTRIK